MVKVLFVNLEDQVGGAEQSLLLLIKYLGEKYRLSLACPQKGELGEYADKFGIERYALPQPYGGRHRTAGSILNLLRTALRLAAIAIRTRPQIIHANNFAAMIVSIGPAFFLRKALIWHCREIPQGNLPLGILSRFCRQIIAVSKAAADNLIKKGVSDRKIKIIHNGTEVPSENKHRPTTTGESIVFGNVGQFVPWKRQTLFLEAARLVGEKMPESRFMLVGDDIFGRDAEYKREILKAASRQELASRVILAGRQKDMGAVWKKMDFLVHCSQEEPFGRVLIEAMANRVAVIAVESGACGEIIRHNITGILVPDKGAAAIAEAMVKLAKDSKLAKRLSGAGCEYVRANFSAERTAEEVGRIYEKLSLPEGICESV